MTRPRAAIVVTGSELVKGEREDRNGPFLAAEAVRLGLDPERITIVGDRPEDLEAAFRLGFAADLCLVSGGLGPTHDDRTIELVRGAAGRKLAVDPALEREIEGISRMIADRLGRPYGDFTTGVRKQATLPEGALSLGLAGTAPGVVLDADDCVVVVLPGPPRDFAGCGRAHSRRRPCDGCWSAPHHAIGWFFASSELRSLRSQRHSRWRGATGTAWRRRSAPVSSRSTSTSSSSPGRSSGRPPWPTPCEQLGRYLFGEDERTIAEIVLDLCRARGLTLATAESCTGGMVAARLTGIPGSTTCSSEAWSPARTP